MNYDAFISAIGLPLTPATRTRVRDAMSQVADDLAQDQRALVRSASGRKIEAPRYLLAETLANGVKQEMAHVLGVSTQALWKYEENNADALMALRTEFAILVRAAIARLRREHQPRG